MLRYLFSSQINWQFFLKHELPKSMPSPGSRSSLLVSPRVAGEEQRSVMTNHSAWRVCITSKSHTLISSLLYQKLGCKFHSLHLNCLTPKLCLCLTMHSREYILISGVKGPLIKALVHTMTLSFLCSDNVCAR